MPFDKVPRQLQSATPSQKLIWYVLKHNGPMTREEVEEVTRLSNDTTHQQIDNLLNKDVIYEEKVRNRVVLGIDEIKEEVQ